MVTARVERRLAAILAADVVGYSRLMERDEDRTLARLKALREELIDPLIAEQQGRVVKLMGDGAPSSSSRASSTRCAAPCSSSKGWPGARRRCRGRSASACGSASTSAT
jgi:class 3 adenylate cyclase